MLPEISVPTPANPLAGGVPHPSRAPVQRMRVLHAYNAHRGLGGADRARDTTIAVLRHLLGVI